VGGLSRLIGPGSHVGRGRCRGRGNDIGPRAREVPIFFFLFSFLFKISSLIQIKI
jgi:hypothetical protein